MSPEWTKPDKSSHNEKVRNYHNIRRYRSFCNKQEKRTQTIQ